MHVPGCVVLKDEEALALLKAEQLLTTMEEKRERSLDEADGEENVMASIGFHVKYNRTKYLAHIYCIDNFEDEEKNGWIVHLWHPKLVMGKDKTYLAYVQQMSADLEVDLNKIGI